MGGELPSGDLGEEDVESLVDWEENVVLAFENPSVHIIMLRGGIITIDVVEEDPVLGGGL